jgi:hypothetical protein
VLLLLSRHRDAVLRLLPLTQVEFVRELCVCAGPTQSHSLLELFVSTAEYCPEGLLQLYTLYTHARAPIVNVLLTTITAEASVSCVAILNTLTHTHPHTFDAHSHAIGVALSRIHTLRASLSSKLLNAFILCLECCPSLLLLFVQMANSLVARGGVSRALGASAFGLYFVID